MEEGIEGVPAPLLKPIEGVTRATDGFVCLYISRNIREYYPRREYRTKGDGRANPMLQALHFDMDMIVKSFKGRKSKARIHIGDREHHCIVTMFVSTKITKTIQKPINYIDSLANINTTLRALHIHISPPISCLGSIYFAISHCHSIPPYNSSLHRPCEPSLLH